MNEWMNEIQFVNVLQFSIFSQPQSYIIPALVFPQIQLSSEPDVDRQISDDDACLLID
jgi:hypothetical protein